MFQRHLAAGEAAEFEDGDLGAAGDAYARILDEVRMPRLRAIAHANLGRVDDQKAIQIVERLTDRDPDDK